jgi:hypothetical protein
VPIVLKSGSLNLLEPSGPVKACIGFALPFTVFALALTSEMASFSEIWRTQSNSTQCLQPGKAKFQYNGKVTIDFQMHPIDTGNIQHFESVLTNGSRIHSSLIIILIFFMMSKLTTTNFLLSGSVHKQLVPGIKYRFKMIHNSIQYTQYSSHNKWLNGEKTTYSRTISALVIRELNTSHICSCHEICAVMGFYTAQNGNSIKTGRDNQCTPS